MHLPEYFTGDLIATVAFGIVAILLVVAGYRLFDYLTPKLDFDAEIQKGNVAMAILVAAFVLGLSYVIARVVAAVLGSQS
jgi:uncharacterized membrane protein YjfL (UPF0719 family)